MPAHLAESPLTCVAVGSGRSLEEFEAIHRSQQEFEATGGAATLAPARRRRSTSFGVTSHVYDKKVRRRRAVLGAARRLLPDPPDRLLRRVGRQPAAQRAARLPEVLSPIQEGASRALKPVRDLFGWFGDTLDAKNERDQLEAQRDQLLAAGRRLPGRARAERGAAARCSRSTTAGLDAYEPAHRARHRPLAERLVLDDHRSTRARAPACASTSRWSPAAGSSAQVSDGRRRTPRSSR